MSLSTMGMRVGLGVGVGSSGVVGTSAGTTCHSTACTQAQNKRKASAQHGSPKENAHLTLMQQTALPASFQGDAHGLRPARNGTVTVRLANLPLQTAEGDVHAMLAPWGGEVLELLDAGCSEESRAFDAQMSKEAAKEAIHELDSIDVGGNCIVVSSADIFRTNRLSSDGGSRDELWLADSMTI